MATWQADGSQVFDGAAPTTWTALDLKAVAGGGSTSHPSAKTLALLKVEDLDGAAFMAFRPAGSSRNTYIAASDGHGCCMLYLNGSTRTAATVLVPTSATGTLEWDTNSAVDTQITLIGFVEATDAGAIIEDGLWANLPTTWTTLDLTEDVSADPTGMSGESLVFLWSERTGGTGGNAVAIRPTAQARDGFMGDDVMGGAAQGITSGFSVEGYACAATTSGEVDIQAEDPPPMCEVTLDSFVQDGWVASDTEVYAQAYPPTSWTDLDLSGQIGTIPALVMLEIHMEEDETPTETRVAVRTDGESSNLLLGNATYSGGASCCSIEPGRRAMLLAETSASGVVEWIASSASLRFDVRLAGAVASNPAPVISNAGPTTSTVAPDAVIQFDTADETSVELTTITLGVTWPGASSETSIISSGQFQGLYSGTISANASNGYDVRVDPIPMTVGTFSAEAYCEDNGGESDTENWSWTVVADSPEVSQVSTPEVVLSLDDPWTFNVSDDYGIDPATLVVRLVPPDSTAIVAYTGGAWQTGWGGSIAQGSETYSGYPLTIVVHITDFPEDLTTAKKYIVQVDATSITGEAL